MGVKIEIFYFCLYKYENHFIFPNFLCTTFQRSIVAAIVLILDLYFEKIGCFYKSTAFSYNLLSCWDCGYDFFLYVNYAKR